MADTAIAMPAITETAVKSQLRRKLLFDMGMGMGGASDSV
jgi:hypothetical protein